MNKEELAKELRRANIRIGALEEKCNNIILEQTRFERLKVRKDQVSDKYTRVAWIAAMNSETKRIEVCSRRDHVGINKFGKVLLDKYNTEKKAFKFILEESSDHPQGSDMTEYWLREEFKEESQELESEVDTLYYFYKQKWYVQMNRSHNFIPLEAAQDSKACYFVRDQELEMIATGKGSCYETLHYLALCENGRVFFEPQGKIIPNPYTFFAKDVEIKIGDTKYAEDIRDGFGYYKYTMNL